MIADTDTIIRYLTKDDPAKALRFKNYLLSGKTITLNTVTFAEIYWTLTTFYKYSKEKTIVILEALVGTKGVSCDREQMTVAIRLLRLYNISYVDAYIAAYALINNNGEVLSYDRGFDRVKGIKRYEP